MRRSLVLIVAVAVMMAMAAPASAGGQGATRVSGIGYPATDAQCPGEASYKLLMTGDLVGCLYGQITSYQLAPSGVYKERADETFVGSYNGRTGSFGMTENFHAKFADGGAGNEIFGFCKHPIKTGSGEDDFTGVSGRLDFKDEVDDPLDVFFPYKGSLRFS